MRCARLLQCPADGGRRTLAARVAVKLGIALPPRKEQQWSLIYRFVGPTPEGKVSLPASAPIAHPSQRAVKREAYHQAKVLSDDFLASYEWRALRMRVLKKHGARCQCCGATPWDGVRMHVDHIKPRRHFPELALQEDNRQVLCEVCNHGKGNWDETDWRTGS